MSSAWFSTFIAFGSYFIISSAEKEKIKELFINSKTRGEFLELININNLFFNEYKEEDCEVLDGNVLKVDNEELGEAFLIGCDLVEFEEVS